MRGFWKYLTATVTMLAVALLLIAEGQAATKEVETKDGKIYIGEVSDLPGGRVNVTPLNPLESERLITLKKSDVKEVRDFKADAARTQFRKDRAAAGEDADAIRTLAGWALDRGLALDAEILYDELATKGDRLSQIQLEKLKKLAAAKARPATPDRPTTPGETTKTPGSTAVVGAVAQEYTGDEGERAIKSIMLREYLASADDRPLVKFDRQRVRDAKDADAYKAFLVSKPADEETLRDLLAKSEKDASYLDPLTFSPEPRALRDWTVGNNVRSLQETVITSCATAKCHASGGAAKFVLLTPPGGKMDTKYFRKTSVAYANYEYIRQYDKGTLLRPSFPAESPFLKYGLPDADKRQLIGVPDAIAKHPAVKGMERDSRNYKTLLEWIARLSILPTKVEDTPPAADNANK